jgi:hypothetical protein
VQYPSENIPAMNCAVLGMGERNRSLLGKSLMRTSSIVVVNIFLQHTDEMAVVQDEQLIEAFLRNRASPQPI